MTTAIPLIVVGARGRMGVLMGTLADRGDEFVPCAGIEAAGHPGTGQPWYDGATVNVTDKWPEEIPPNAVALCVVTGGAVEAHALEAAKHKVPLVVGSTAMTTEDRKALRKASRSVPVLVASNFSLGVTLLSALVEQAAKSLPVLYDIEITEMHHRNKIDAPSGTAIALGKAAAAGRDVNYDDVAVYDRHGSEDARQPGQIGMTALRGGGVVGDHSVLFAGDEEVLTLSHRAHSREVFVRGAFKAAAWIVDKRPGLYTMRDVLGV